jgi:hypothetical protein
MIGGRKYRMKNKHTTTPLRDPSFRAVVARGTRERGIPRSKDAKCRMKTNTRPTLYAPLMFCGCSTLLLRVRGSFAPHMRPKCPALDDGSRGGGWSTVVNCTCLCSGGSFAPHAYTQPLMPMTDLRLGNTKLEIEVALALGMEAFV